MLSRARFLDDWRLSRIDEEVERLSVNSDTSIAVGDPSSSPTSTPLRGVRRSASAEGMLSQLDDVEDPTLPPPPPSLLLPPTPPTRDKPDIELTKFIDEESEALRFLQVKYDTLGKVKVEKNAVIQQQIQLQKQRQEQQIAEDERLSSIAVCKCSHDADMTVTQHCPTGKVGVVEVGPHLSSQHGGCQHTMAMSTETAVHVNCQHHHHHPHHHHHHHHQSDNRKQQCSLRGQQHCVNSQEYNQILHHTCSAQREELPRHHLEAGVCRSHATDETRTSGAETRCCSTLSNAELFQIDLFYRSRRTVAYVCQCTAVLYVARGSSLTSWRPATAGVPVLVYDSVRGGSSPTAVRLHVVLAERGTGFELWRRGLTDVVQQYSVGRAGTTSAVEDNVIEVATAAFHTIRVTPDDVVGLLFDDPSAAEEFHRQLRKFADLDSSNGNGTRRKGKDARSKRNEQTTDAVGSSRKPARKRRTIVNKSDISHPCCFTHVTRLEQGSGTRNVVAASQHQTAARLAESSDKNVQRTRQAFFSQSSNS